MNTIKGQKRLYLPRLQSISLDDKIYNVAITSRQTYLLTFFKEAVVIHLDENLNIVWKKYVDLKPPFRISVSQNDAYFALAGKKDINVFEFDGKEVFKYQHDYWKSYNGTDCIFSLDNQYFLYFTSAENGIDDCLQIRKLGSFKLIKEVNIKREGYYYMFTQSPQNNSFLIEAAAGQDGCILYGLTFNEKNIQIKEWDNDFDRIVGNFSSDGKEVITAPHGLDTIIIYSFPEQKELLNIFETDVFEYQDPKDKQLLEDNFDFFVKCMFNEWIILQSRFERLVAINRNDRNVMIELVPDGCPIESYYAHDSKKTIENAEGYSRNLFDYQQVDENKMMLIHDDNMLTIFDVSQLCK